MDAVLRRLPLRDTQEQQPRLTRSRHDQYRVVLRHVAGPDLALQQRGPERGQHVRVSRVEGDLVNLEGSVLAVCHDAQETTRGAVRGIDIPPVPSAGERMSRCQSSPKTATLG